MMKNKSKSSGFKADTGSAKMAGFSGAAPAESGKMSVGGRKGNTKFAADTGSGKMAGMTGASPARPA